MSENDFEGRIALVTGASRGLGRAIALELARKKAHVIALATKKDDLEKLDDEIRALGSEATLVPLNLKKADGLDELGLKIYERWKRLDILVANAGILGPMTPLSHVRPREWQGVMDINLTANYRLVRSMDALLRSSPAARTVFISSGITQTKRAYWGPYAVSKAGVEALAYTYAKETEKTNVRVNVVDPGKMRTMMRAEAYPGEDPKTLPKPEDIAPHILKVLIPAFQKTAERFTIDELKKT